jgi:thymidylate synthase (FAD)
MKINVLDHGFVRLVSYMQPVPQEITECAGMGDYRRREVQPEGWSGDLEIVRNARVSYDADWRFGTDEGKDERLIHRMMEGRHSSPFEAMVFTFEVKAPIFVFCQWHLHRTWSYNEVSARYAKLPEEFYIPEPKHIGAQSKDDKQMRTMNKEFPDSAMHQALAIQQSCTDTFSEYHELLSTGVPP